MSQIVAFTVEVVRNESLRGDVILVDAPAVAIGVKDDVALAGRQTPKLRNTDLDHEASAGLQVRARGEPRPALPDSLGCRLC